MITSCVLAVVAPRSASARLVFSQLGDDDPTAAGWSGSLGTGVTGSPLAGSGDGDDLPAWQVNDASTLSGSTGTYLRSPSAPDLAAAAQLGWLVRTTVRVPNPGDAIDASVYVELALAADRYGLEFGSDASGNALVRFFGGGGPAHTIAGATFHTYEVVYHPATHTADLRVDGALLESGFAGIPVATAPRFVFGSAQSSSTGRGQFQRVEWIVNDDADHDGVGDPEDNCVYIGNADQADPGGVGAASVADGVGSACQCGDLDGDGRITPIDLGLLRDSIAEIGSGLSPAALARCSVSADPTACDVETAARVTRALEPLPPSLANRCAAYTGFGEFCGDEICTGEPGSCWSTPPGCQVDCGACLLGAPCNADADCASGNCMNAVCTANVNSDPNLAVPADGRCDPAERCTQTHRGSDPDSCGPCLVDDRCTTDAQCASGLLCRKRGLCGGGQCPVGGTLAVTLGLCDTLRPCLATPAGQLCNVDAPPGTTCTTDTDCSAWGGGSGICLGGDCTCGGATTPCDQELAACTCRSGCADADRICDDGAPCFDDTDCASGSCKDWKVCMLAGCGGSGQPKCPEGVGCTSTAQCETGLVCHLGRCGQPLPDGAICTQSTECAGGICNLGQCASDLLGNGEACTTDAACQSGVCVGFCVVPDCGNGTCNPLAETCGTSTPSEQLPCAADCGRCPLNHVCAANLDCESGFCDVDFWGGSPYSACRPCQEANAGLCPNGSPCNGDVDCQGTSICQSGYCAPPPPPCSGSDRPDGCQCTSSSQCASNLCASIPNHPDVCAPASCSGKLPGSACLANSGCCDFPGVNISCSWFICQP